MLVWDGESVAPGGGGGAGARPRKGGMVQAGQAKRTQVAQDVLAGLAVLADPTPSPEYLPESTPLFNETLRLNHSGV